MCWNYKICQFVTILIRVVLALLLNLQIFLWSSAQFKQTIKIYMSDLVVLHKYQIWNIWYMNYEYSTVSFWVTILKFTVHCVTFHKDIHLLHLQTFQQFDIKLNRLTNVTCVFVTNGICKVDQKTWIRWTGYTYNNDLFLFTISKQTICIRFYITKRKTHRMLTNMKRFAKTTSLKGVPRIVNSDSTFLRTVWICAVLSFLILGFWQVRF